MPPPAILSSVSAHHLQQAVAVRSRRHSRSRELQSPSGAETWALQPNPPCAASKFALAAAATAVLDQLAGRRPHRPGPGASAPLAGTASAARPARQPRRAACARRRRRPRAPGRNPGMPIRGVRRPVRAAVERLQVGRQKHRHRPAAAAGHHLHRVHVDLIEVGPLLAIDLDADERARSRRPRSPAFSKLSCSITWHQWQAE